MITNLRSRQGYLTHGPVPVDGRGCTAHSKVRRRDDEWSGRAVIRSGDSAVAPFGAGPPLRGLAARGKAIHPMAFEFASRHPDRLFFPTVHVHDGQVHLTAAFSHALYCQVPEAIGSRLLAEPRVSEPIGPPKSWNPHQSWVASDGTVSAFVDTSRAEGIMDANAVAYRRQVFGLAPNTDQWVQP
jgi:hypothetical protein